MQKDLLKLARIIQSSSRVEKARAMVGLKKNEYIRRMASTGLSIAKINNKKQNDIIREVHTLGGMAAMQYLFSHVYPYIDKEIVEYFGLKTRTAHDCILRGKTPTEDFSFWYQLDRKTGKMNISITLNHTLTPKSRGFLLHKIDDVNFLVEEFYRTENTKGLGTLKTDHQKVKGVSHFDEKFDLSKKYKNLRGKYPTRIPKKEMDSLLEIAKKSLVKEDYSADDFRKEIFDFDKYFEAS